MLDGWYVPDNPATQIAREMYNVFAIKRNPGDGINTCAKEEVQCLYCTHRGNKKKYPKYLMTQIIRYRKRKSGHSYEVKQYLCPECAKNYTPHEKRVGGRNY